MPLYPPASAGGGSGFIQKTSWPTGADGIDGNYCIVQNTAGTGPANAVLVGPRVAGAWPTIGLILGKGSASTVVSGGGIYSGPAQVATPAQFIFQDGTALPVASVSSGVTFVGANLRSDGTNFYANALANTGSNRYGMTHGTSGAVVESLTGANCLITAMPTEAAGAIGCGSLGAYHAYVWTDKNGKLHLGYGLGSGGLTDLTTPTAAGVVTVNDILTYERRGELLVGHCVSSSTGQILAELQCNITGATGVSGYFVGTAPAIFYQTVTGKLAYTEGFA